MKCVSSHALGGAALAFSVLFAPMSEALAQSYDHTVTLTSEMGAITRGVCGNSNDSNGSCSNLNPAFLSNLVTIESGATVNPSNTVSGRYDEATDHHTTATGNRIVIYGTAHDLFAGNAYSWAGAWTATATRNQVDIHPGARAWDGVGGRAYSEGAAASATENSVFMYGGTASSSLTGGWAKSDTGDNASATLNQVFIEGGEVEFAMGGTADGRENSTATASNNTVSIRNGRIRGVRGGDVYADNGTATASNNTVLISGGELWELEIYGARTGSSGPAVISNNTVSITGGELQGSSIFGGAGYSDSHSATASNNTVEIKGDVSIDSLDGLYGGWGDASTGNTLELYLSGVSVHELDYFQNLNFHIPANLGNGSMISLFIHPAWNNSTATIDNATISVEIAEMLNVGERIVLMDATVGILSGTPNSAVISLTPSYAFEVVQTELANNRLVVEVTDAPHPVLSKQSIRATTLSTNFFVTSNMNTTGAWQVLPASQSCPSAANLFTDAKSSTANMAANVDFSTSLPGLTLGTSYRLCFVASSYGAYSQVWDMTFMAGGASTKDNSETTGNNVESGRPKGSGCDGCTSTENTSFAELGFVLSLALLARLRRRTTA